MEKRPLTAEDEIMINSVGKILIESLTDELLVKYQKLFPEDNTFAYMEALLMDIRKRPSAYFTDEMIRRVIDMRSLEGLKDLVNELFARWRAHTDSVYYPCLFVDFDSNRNDIMKWFAGEVDHSDMAAYLSQPIITEFNRDELNEVAMAVAQKIQLARSLGKQYAMPKINLDEIDINRLIQRDKITIYTKYTLFLDSKLVSRKSGLTLNERIVGLTRVMDEVLHILPDHETYSDISNQIYTVDDDDNEDEYLRVDGIQQYLNDAEIPDWE